MIHAHQRKDGSFIVFLDPAEHIVLSKMGDEYCLSNSNMLIACINKGMDNIGKLITKRADPRVPNSEKDDTDKPNAEPREWL